MVIIMNFRKILAISLILIALSISVTVVCAGQTNIDLGKITSSSIATANITVLAKWEQESPPVDPDDANP